MSRPVTPNSPALPAASNRLLTNADFARFAEVPPEIEWFANIDNAQTRRAHIIAWRDELVSLNLSAMTIRHRLAALSSLFEYLCERNTVTHNPVKGVKGPTVENYEDKALALRGHQARKLLDAPGGNSLKSKRDRAISATLLYHALRRDELQAKSKRF